ncbi:hypothetical protein GGS23DRAFT_132232 [Durotheca rogersii]|uniref:uncharacterized protein n=1 Tax=Durotheca rogersii TaxID=419775 RepID=UPI0022202531|nr:uncharacterized protein GGS23DRAFT_132232 [Durotheca rogersii]KAI5861800.1 hypothetical protein GGS23DRAFT_132232 [Durotheca rogersii]
MNAVFSLCWAALTATAGVSLGVLFQPFFFVCLHQRRAVYEYATHTERGQGTRVKPRRGRGGGVRSPMLLLLLLLLLPAVRLCFIFLLGLWLRRGGRGICLWGNKQRSFSGRIVRTAC